MQVEDEDSTGSFGQNFYLNGLEIKDDSKNYTRPYVRTVVFLTFWPETSVFKI